MTEIHLDTFKETFKSYVISDNKISLRNILNDEKICEILIDNCMDFLSLIMENVMESSVNKDEERIYSKLINYIAENSNAKEILCVINLEIDRVVDDSKFLILLYPLSVSLQKLPVSSDSTIRIMKDILNSAVGYFDRLPVAHYSGLEGKELEVYIHSSETQRFLRLSNCYLEFLESFNSQSNFIDDCRIREEILHNILVLYNSSLLKLAFYAPGIVSEDCRKCSNRAFELVESLVGCLHRFILILIEINETVSVEIIKTKDSQHLENLRSRLIPYSGIACLLYHTFVGQNLKKFPQIFSNAYKFTFSLPVITVCFKESVDSNVLRLCLQLLQELLNSLQDDCSISWDNNLHLPFFYSLKVALTSNVNREIRSLAFSCFGIAFQRLDIEARYNLLKVMLKDGDHHGFKGQLISLLKNEIIDALLSKDERNRFFRGGLVYPMLCEVLILSDNEKTDILNESEWILHALNMLYVLLQRDKTHCLGLDVIMEDVTHDFLEPLIKGTELCLGHFKNDLRLLLDCNASSVIEELSIDCAWMNNEQKVDFINKAILTLDLVKLNTTMVTNVL